MIIKNKICPMYGGISGRECHDQCAWWDNLNKCCVMLSICNSLYVLKEMKGVRCEDRQGKVKR